MRPDPLAEAAARRHELTRSRAVQALRELDRSGARVTFADVARAAGVSDNARLRRQLARALGDQRSARTRSGNDPGS